MGVCSSRESTMVATVMLILEDGRLQEYPYPTKASYALQKISPTSFICNSDELGFNDVVTAVGDNEELKMGQLYFSLPLSLLNRLLNRRLEAADMAALAVKACSALGRRSGNVVAFSGKNIAHKPPGNIGETGSRRRNTNSNAGRRRRGKFTARMSAIPE